MTKQIDKSDRHEAVDTLTYEIALLTFRMTAAAREHVGQGRHSPGRRSVLRQIGAQGPQTVPDMARIRAVSRQHVQVLVNELKADGLVLAKPHPDDGRTRLIHLTAEGEELLAAMQAREALLFDFIAEGISSSDLRTTTQVVRRLRARLESEGWTELLARV